MVANATPKRIDQKWQYRVRIQDLVVGHFNQVSSLEGEVEMTEYHQGGDPDPALQTPGKRKHTDVTLSAGASESDELWTWWQQVYDVEGRGENLDVLRKKVFVDVLGRDGETVLRTHTLNRAIPKKFVAGDFDANSSDNVIEQITLAYKNLNRA